MAWVKMVDVDAADGKLQEMYERVRKRIGVVPNITMLQSLRPATMECGYNLYRQIMDDPTGGRPSPGTLGECSLGMSSAPDGASGLLPLACLAQQWFPPAEQSRP